MTKQEITNHCAAFRQTVAGKAIDWDVRHFAYFLHVPTSIESERAFGEWLEIRYCPYCGMELKYTGPRMSN